MTAVTAAIVKSGIDAGGNGPNRWRHATCPAGAGGLRFADMGNAQGKIGLAKEQATPYRCYRTKIRAYQARRRWTIFLPTVTADRSAARIRLGGGKLWNPLASKTLPVTIVLLRAGVRFGELGLNNCAAMRLILAADNH